MKKIESALISVYHKDNLDVMLEILHKGNVKIFSTGGTFDFIKSKGIPVVAVEEITGYPSIFGGRVKTLHPKVMGGILYRRKEDSDIKELSKFEIPSIDLVVVDLYPFEETLKKTTHEDEIIEKIDIGGISLIRAAAKNFNDVLIVPAVSYYQETISLLKEKNLSTELADRRRFAGYAFHISSHYDTAIFNHFSDSTGKIAFKSSVANPIPMRYGENPHQTAEFYGDLSEVFTKLHGKELSYNNLLDVEAAFQLIGDFDETTVAVIKHNNACGLASRPTLCDAWKMALSGDPVSAFGGIIITNKPIDEATAIEMNTIFFEVVIAPGFSQEALAILSSKKNRIILESKNYSFSKEQARTMFNGIIRQDKDLITEQEIKLVTNKIPTDTEKEDLLFANKIVKHTKSNAIVLAKNKQLIGSGTGQTSRVDALKQAIDKANHFRFDIKGAVMASDAFFPFDDCVSIAHEAGITAVIHPGGSIRDNDSVEYCNKNSLSMIMTGTRHFKH